MVRCLVLILGYLRSRVATACEIRSVDSRGRRDRLHTPTPACPAPAAFESLSRIAGHCRRGAVHGDHHIDFRRFKARRRVLERRERVGARIGRRGTDLRQVLPGGSHGLRKRQLVAVGNSKRNDSRKDTQKAGTASAISTSAPPSSPLASIRARPAAESAGPALLLLLAAIKRLRLRVKIPGLLTQAAQYFHRSLSRRLSPSCPGSATPLILDSLQSGKARLQA